MAAPDPAPQLFKDSSCTGGGVHTCSKILLAPEGASTHVLSVALALSLILLRRLRQPVRRLQLERERGKVEPAALNEQPGVPTALFRAEEQERALGIIGRGGGNQARNGMT